MKLTGKSYLLPLYDYTMKDHSILYSFFIPWRITL